MRADQLLVHRGLAASRSQAQRLIESGVRALTRDGWRALSKSDTLCDDADLELLDGAEAQYVSRGGLKLEAALRRCGVQPAGKLCLDVGQSTGGFTDCLLQQGACRVVGVDVGHGQLHAKLRQDARVRCLERINARALQAADLLAQCEGFMSTSEQGGVNEGLFDLIVGDVSFISQTLILPRLAALLAPGAEVLMLVKPQFELQAQDLGKGGVVRDAALYARVEQRIRGSCAQLALVVRHYIDSPILGGDGNHEFFVHAVKE